MPLGLRRRLASLEDLIFRNVSQMAAVEINWNPTHKDLRIFAGLQIVFFAIVAYLVNDKTGSIAGPVWIVCISAVIGMIGLAKPSLIRLIYVGWMAAVFPLGWASSHIILLIVYYFVVTPIGLIMRVCGHDPMRRKFDRDTTTYWISRRQSTGTNRYFKQF